MDEVARSDVRTVLRDRFGIVQARRATDTDSTEEILLLTAEDFLGIDEAAVTLAIMDVLPHVKVWVTQESPSYDSERL